MYPPFFALALTPLAVLPLPLAASLWYVINIGLIALSINAVRALLSGGAPRGLPGWALPASAVALGGVFLDNLALGQANPAMLALTTAAALGFTRPGRQLGAGALLGVACAIKMYAALLLAPALMRGRWTAALGFAAGLLVAGALLPAAVLGPENAVGLMRTWREKVVAPTVAGTLQGSVHWDQSPQAALRRLTIPEPAFDGVRVNVTTLSEASYRRASRALAAGLFALLAWVWVFGPGRGSRESFVLDLALAYCGTLLVFGYNLKAHYIALLLPAALAAGALWSAGAPASSVGSPPGPRDRARAVRLLRRALLGFGAALLAVSNPGLAGRTLSNWALAYSCLTLATLLIAGVLIERRLRRPAAESP